MKKSVLFSLLLVLGIAKGFSQYTPITVTGFTQDVIAEGTGNSSLTTTTEQMDAITPSNFVLCTNQFSLANAMGVGGLPNNLLITSGTNTYQIVTGVAIKNALSLRTSQTGTLTLATAGSYGSISLLAMATEATTAPTISVTCYFTDGSNTVTTTTIADWWGTTTTNAITTTSGRVKRKDNITTADKEVDGTKAYFFPITISLPCGKVLQSVAVTNTSGTTVTESRRAFIFAISGIASSPLVSPIVNPGVVCAAGGQATLTVTNPQAGLTYSWYTAAFGGVAVATGTSYTTPVIAANATYYIVAANAGGCATTRLPILVTVAAPPAAPLAAGSSICAGSTATITVAPTVAGTTYNLYTAATGGTAIATSTTGIFTTPVIATSTTFYVGATTGTGVCPSVRTPVLITFLTPFANPVVSPTTIGTTSLTFSWAAVVGATGYEVSTNGTTFTVPSSGATGLTHTVSGLAIGQTVTLTVRTLAANACQVSSGIATATTITDQVYVPNVFTPNNDGKNDELYVYSNVIQTMRFQIFNQWGEKIFESNNKSLGWAGSYKGKQQPSGVYIYTLHVVTNSNQVIDRKGSITLVR